jgi:hypothetical protein
MKTITKFLKPLLSVLTVMFFCTVASAQTLEELVALQSDLQNIVTLGNAKLNDANATANMTAQEIADFQAEINAAQSKLAAITPIMDELLARAMRDREAQIAADALAAQLADEAAQAPGKAAIEAQYNAEQAQMAAAQTARTAEEQALTQKQAAISNPGRYAPAPDPNHPTWMPFSVSTGNAEQDAQLVRDWLQQHGFIR